MCHARSIVNEVAVTFNFVQDIFMHEINRNQQHNSEYCEDQVFPHENSAAGTVGCRTIGSPHRLCFIQHYTIENRLHKQERKYTLFPLKMFYHDCPLTAVLTSLVTK